ncbi:pentapeptide repeat-containing protein [Streptomyces sp. NPDC004129]
MDTVCFFPQRVHATASTQLALFQQSDHRRHPRPPQQRRHDKPSLPRDRRTYAPPAKTQSSRPEQQQLLSGADLNEADLSGALLKGAHLNRADLTDAYLGGARLDGADLTDSRGYTHSPSPETRKTPSPSAH